jgi:hypothetical protein
VAFQLSEKWLWLLISQEALPNGARKNGFDSQATKELELFFLELGVKIFSFNHLLF